MPRVLEFAVDDIVALYGGKDQMVIVDLKPNRPANPYVGVLVKGKGAPYKFGPRQRPQKIGVADKNHPALVAYRERMGQLGGSHSNADVEYRKQCVQLADMVLSTTMALQGAFLREAQELAQKIRDHE